VSRYIALTQFARDKFIAGGLPGEKIAVKPNFVGSDPGIGTGNGNYALFVGRLSEEKGIRTLLDAWGLLSTSHRLRIVGEGPLAHLVKNASSMDGGIEWLGRRSKEEVLKLMANAAFLIFPSTWYETFGLVIIEAFSVGLPVIASRLGAMEELVSDGETGRLFMPRRSDALAAAIEWAFSHREKLQEMGHRARNEFEKKYTASANYEMLADIYQSALNNRTTK
jgi:glycosyltransferase involved in cell wall biosynthesis